MHSWLKTWRENTCMYRFERLSVYAFFICCIVLRMALYIKVSAPMYNSPSSRVFSVCLRRIEQWLHFSLSRRAWTIVHISTYLSSTCSFLLGRTDVGAVIIYHIAVHRLLSSHDSPVGVAIAEVRSSCQDGAGAFAYSGRPTWAGADPPTFAAIFPISPSNPACRDATPEPWQLLMRAKRRIEPV